MLNWTSIEERMPPKDVYVLIRGDSGYHDHPYMYMEAKYYSERGKIVNVSSYILTERMQNIRD